MAHTCINFWCLDFFQFLTTTHYICSCSSHPSTLTEHSHLTDDKLHIVVESLSEFDGPEGGGAGPVSSALRTLLLGCGIHCLPTTIPSGEVRACHPGIVPHVKVPKMHFGNSHYHLLEPIMPGSWVRVFMNWPDWVARRNVVTILIKVLVNGSVEVGVVGGVEIAHWASWQSKTTHHCVWRYVCEGMCIMWRKCKLLSTSIVKEVLCTIVLRATCINLTLCIGMNGWCTYYNLYSKPPRSFSNLYPTLPWSKANCTVTIFWKQSDH